METIQAISGIIVAFLFCYFISSDKKNINCKFVITGFILQCIIALLVIKVEFINIAFLKISKFVNILQLATQHGMSFVFGYLGSGVTPFVLKNNASEPIFILAFQALPLIMVVSAITSLLFYWRVIPVIIKSISKFLEKTLGIGGPLGLSASSTIFFGLDIAPLVVKPHLKSFSRSEIFSLMTCGMATVASSVMLLYAKILHNTFTGGDSVILQHIITAALMNVPAALTISRIMIPQIGSCTVGRSNKNPLAASSTMDAISKGIQDGVNVLVSVIAMLISLTALIYVLNVCLGLLPYINNQKITLQLLFGYIFAPITWLMGIPWNEAKIAGSIMGFKISLNEIVAYQELAKNASLLSAHTKIIMLYAICGFANFGSIGVIIGTMGTIVPDKRNEIAALGMKSVLSGTIATCISGAIIGILV